MKRRNPQLALRLDAAMPDATARWQEGAPLTYLGGPLILRLDTRRKEAALAAGELHLPLPPEATPRQVQDAAESWLRAEAQRVIAGQVALAARQRGLPTPVVVLSFATRASWAQMDSKDGVACLRFHWRLVEQRLPVIAQVAGQAVAKLPRVDASLDLFSLA
jgi:predicted metal-dependent hydrolase